MFLTLQSSQNSPQFIASYLQLCEYYDDPHKLTVGLSEYVLGALVALVLISMPYIS